MRWCESRIWAGKGKAQVNHHFGRVFMPIVPPPKERYKIQDDGSTLKICIPSRKNYFTLFFLGFWLIGWAFGEIMVGRELIAGAGSSGNGLFILAWLGLWTIGGGFALYEFFWQLAGKEMIEISADAIKIQRAILGLGRIREYMSTYIKDLRIAPLALGRWFDRAWAFWWGILPGVLAFDYGSQTIRFGGGVDEAGAKQILERIVARFPRYRTDS